MADEKIESTEEEVEEAVGADTPAEAADDAPAREAEPVVAAEPEPDAASDEVGPEPAVEPAAEPLAAEAEASEEPAQEPADEPSDTGEPSEPAAEATPPAAKAKRKRLPRALRRQRTKPKREKPAERKPITRLPKPEYARGRRQERQGTVVSAAADKTIVVRVDVVKLHPTYKKVIRRSTKLHAHDDQNAAKVGDVVRIVETRPLSRMKRWRLQAIVEEAK